MPNQTFHLPVIQTNYARILVEVFADYGLDKHKLLSDAGLPADLFQTESDYIPSESIKRLIHLTSSQLGITKFTDLLVLVFRRRVIPNVLHQFVSFQTIGASMQHIDEIFSLDSPAVMFVSKPIMVTLGSVVSLNKKTHKLRTGLKHLLLFTSRNSSAF